MIVATDKAVQLSAAAAPSRSLAATAKSSYLHYLWGMSFGIVTVLATPLVLAAALVLGLGKNTHDLLMHMRRA